MEEEIKKNKMVALNQRNLLGFKEDKILKIEKELEM